jgi:hypothetical protein
MSNTLYRHGREFRTSSYSNGGTNCVAADVGAENTELADSKNLHGATLCVPAANWAAFLADISES